MARLCVTIVEEFFESFSLEVKIDYRKYRFGFSAVQSSPFFSTPQETETGSPPPGPGGAHPEGGRCPGGNDRAGRLILSFFL